MTMFEAIKAKDQQQSDGSALAPSVFLQPISPPASFGLFGFFVANTTVATWLAGWWGDPGSPGFFFTFAATLGGLVQFLSGMWCFKARDYIGSALLSMWGTFWMAYGLAVGLEAGGVLTIPPAGVPNPALAIWFIPLSLFTLTGAVAALSRKDGMIALSLLLLCTGVGAAFLIGGYWAGSKTWLQIAGYDLVANGVLAWYVASMLMLRSAWNRTILPMGTFTRDGNTPGRRVEHPTEYLHGEPGVRKAGL